LMFGNRARQHPRRRPKRKEIAGVGVSQSYMAGS
jgi:hypothetical protein